MAWTAPRTWTDEELIADTIMNAHVRDNLKYLKGVDAVVTIESGLIIDNTDGDEYFLLPSLTTAEQNALSAVNGMLIYNETTSALNAYEGGAWGAAGVKDHGALTGLGDDDHTIYLLADGTRNLTGNLTVSASVTIDGIDISAHDIATTGVHGVTGTILGTEDVDDTPVNGATTAPLSSNWGYDTKVNMIDAPLSPQLISGGVLSAGTNAGTIKVAALTALLRNDTSDTDPLTYVTLAEQDNLSLTAADTKYYVVLDYNSGSPQILRQVTVGNGTTEIGIGICMKEGDDTIHYQNSGMRLQNGVAKLHRRAATLRESELADGCAISDEGGASRQFGIASGVVYHGISRLTPFTPTAFDSGTNTFTYVHRDGADSWSYTANSTVINNTQYYDGAYALATLTTNRYGCHWVYLHPSDEHVYVVYGETNGKLAEAEQAFAPSDLPMIISDFSLLLGCIIIEKDATAFTTIQMVTDVFFTGTAVADHGSLGGLSDVADHAYALLHNGTRALSGAWDMGSQNLTNVNIDGGTISGVTLDGTLTGGNQTVNNLGHIGLGNTAADTKYTLRIEEYTIELTDNLSRAALRGYIDAYKTSADYTGVLYGYDFSAVVGVDNTQDWTYPTAGLRGVSSLVGTETGTSTAKTLTGAASFYAYSDVRGDAANDLVVTNLYGLYVAAVSLVGNSKLTNDYGIYIGAQAGGATLNYAIYTAGGSVYHVGDLTAANIITAGNVDGIDVSAHDIATTGVHGVTGTIVGTSESQALTNKSYNGLTLTSTTGTFTLASGKTLTVSNTLTLTATDTATLAIGGGGTLGSAAYTASTDYVAKATFGAHSILIAVSDDTPVKLDVAASRIVGRAASGNIVALDKAGALGIINVADGADVTGDNTPQAHSSTHESGGSDQIHSIADDDDDTKIQVEESADEDKIRMDVAGIEAFHLSDIGVLTLVKQSAASVYLSTTQENLVSGTETLVEFDAELYDIQGEFNTATHRFTATEAGLYLIAAQALMTAVVTDKLYLVIIYKNGEYFHGGMIHSSFAQNIGCTVVAVAQLAATDFIELYARSDAGVNTVDIYGAGDAIWTYMDIVKIA